MVTDVFSTAVICGLLAVAIVFTWRISRSMSQGPEVDAPEHSHETRSPLASARPLEMTPLRRSTAARSEEAQCP